MEEQQRYKNLALFMDKTLFLSISAVLFINFYMACGALSLVVVVRRCRLDHFS